MGLGGTSGGVVSIMRHILPCKAFTLHPHHNAADVKQYCCLGILYIRPRRAIEGVLGRLGARNGTTMGLEGTLGCVMTVGSGMHPILPRTADILLIRTGPILLTWHIHDLK
jgi:hypothetical protein